MTSCAREGCGHDRVMHPRAGVCRQPRCTCEGFVAPAPGPEPGEEHAHRWQPAGVVSSVNLRDQIAALCPCGAVIRLQVPEEPANA